jgi:hypothetical protein
VDPFERLMQVFLDDAGALAYSVEDVEHILPWCLVNMPVEMGELDEATVALFVKTCEKAGVPLDGDAETVREGLAAYYAEHPPNRALSAALEAAWHEVNAEAGAQKNPFAKFSGSQGPTGVLGGGERPQGTVPGGVLARLAGPPPKKPKG